MTHPLHESGPALHFERLRPRLVSLARGWLGNAADAQDAVQDTWLRMACALPGSLPATAEGAQGWLLTVLRHVCIDRLRRRSLEARHREQDWQHAGNDAGAPSAEELASLNERALAMIRLLARYLTRSDAAGLLLQSVFDFRHDEIAAHSGASEATQRQRIHRAMALVRKRLGDDLPHAPARHADEARTGKEQSDRDESFARLCLMAVREARPAPLIAYLARPAPLEAAARQAVESAGQQAVSPPPFEVRVVCDSGNFALVWKLDGVVSCVVPLGELSSPRDCEADLATADRLHG